MPVCLTLCMYFFLSCWHFGCLMSEQRSQRYQIPTGFVKIDASVEERTKRIPFMPVLFVSSLQVSQNMRYQPGTLIRKPHIVTSAVQNVMILNICNMCPSRMDPKWTTDLEEFLLLPSNPFPFGSLKFELSHPISVAPTEPYVLYGLGVLLLFCTPAKLLPNLSDFLHTYS